MTLRSRCMLAFVLAVFLVSALSCGHEQQLVGITIQPDTENFGAANIPLSQDAGLSVQLRALGQYIHPPVTKDITNQVTWASNTPDMVSVDSTGMITATGGACGGTLISATVNTNHSIGNLSSSGAIITSNMQANVICPTGTGTGGSDALLTIDFVGPTNSGNVTITPTFFTCSTNCGVLLPTGTAVNVSATANTGFTFGGWNGCDSPSGQATCIINSLTADRTVTVTFN